MQESVIYQDIKAEGIQEGIQQGIQIRVREERQLALKLLARKVGEVPDDDRSRIDQLELAQVQALIEALLDFEQLDDLANWLSELDQQDEEPETGSETA